MSSEHHYPYPNKNHVINDYENRHAKVWSMVFPSRYIEDPLGRSYTDSIKFLEMFSSSFVAGKSKDACFHYLKLAQQFCQAHFRLALNPEVDLVLELDGEHIPATGKHTLDYTDVNSWDTAFCLAMILRDNEALIGTLCRFQAENYINPKVEDLPIDYPYCKFLQGLFDPKAELQTLVQEIATLSSPEYIPERRQSYIYNIWLPFIELIIAVLARDETRYQQGIEKALLSHNNHYATEKRKHIAKGWLPMHIVAAAAMAYDQCGFKLPFVSPYLPEWLVYGEFE